MIKLRTPRGLAVDVPELLFEDPSPKFAVDQVEQIRSYYAEHGYVVVKTVIPQVHCDRIRALWDREIKQSDEFIYRQATAKAERHVRNAQGWIMNPILNLQSVNPDKYPEFRRFATHEILTHSCLAGTFKALLQDEPTIVQSMYFEGNSATWEHQDSYYLDSERIGAMTAAWIAVEDIAATAGRFFICPGSHKLDLGRQSYDNNIVDHHEEYIGSVVERIKQLGLPIRAPYLQKGDTLFWNSWTIHGSLDSQDPAHSRSSITCHAIPSAHHFLQHQSRVIRLRPALVNGVRVHRPKDLARLSNRLIFHFETRHPKVFYGAKSVGLRWRFRLRALTASTQAAKAATQEA